jgi:hypothetical protein
MEGLFVLLILLGSYLLIVPLIAIVQGANAKKEAREATLKLNEATKRLEQLARKVEQLQNRPEDLRHPHTAQVEETSRPFAETPPEPSISGNQDQQDRSTPPPLVANNSLDSLNPLEALSQRQARHSPAQSSESPAPGEPFSLERFMGVKLFAWLGGLALFFGMSFFVKFAFDNNLIPPSLRITLGFVTGLGLLIGGLVAHRLPKYQVLAQAFCATGVLVHYGVSFAAHAIYHFPLFGTLQTFVVMAVITFVAFMLAVRLNALVVAVLGMLGGFLTPVLLSTGEDQVFGLFGYIALLDIGLLAVSRHRCWRSLMPLAALGTGLMQLGWTLSHFTSGNYSSGSKILIPMGIALGFLGLFLVGGWLGRRKLDHPAAASVVGLAAVALAFGFMLIGKEQVATRHLLLYGFLLLTDLAVILAVARQPYLRVAQVIAALVIFVHLIIWNKFYLTAENLEGALAIYLILGALHAVVPGALSPPDSDEGTLKPPRIGAWEIPAVMLLIFMPILQLMPLPMTVWGAVLLADLALIGLAVGTGGAILPLLAALLLTMGLAVTWFERMPANPDSLLPFLGLVGGFATLFLLAASKLSRPQPPEAEADQLQTTAFSILTAVLPFTLLIFATLRVPVPDPTPVFGVALAMAALLGWLTLRQKSTTLILVALAGTLAVEAVWYSAHFRSDTPMIALSWHLGIYAAFTTLPFIFRKRCDDFSSPWIASALSGVGHFLLVHDLVKRAFPNDFMGIVPAAFAVPTLASLWVIRRTYPTMDAIQRSRLAWFGGAMLWFLALIIPIQLERQWVTLSWAIEGALLLWLFRRVNHPGLPMIGLVLLALAFLRLTLNPFPFTALLPSGNAIFNWHLYTYGLAAGAQFAAAGWFTDPERRFARYQPRAVLNALGGVLLFVLLNIEIADYFSPPESPFVAFEFGGNFARDMTFSIAWGLFSLGLLVTGFRFGSKHTRFAAVALLAITLLKVFLHDLAAIENIFRIGALIGVAVIAFVASFLYQRYFDRTKL